MIQKKICMLGTLAVGKTSLVRRFVDSMFSERYQTTIGVKVDRKDVQVNGREVTLMLWDLEGTDDFNELRPSFLRGSAGYLLVVDGTRPNSLERAEQIHQRVTDHLGKLPFTLVLNKADLVDDWHITADDEARLTAAGWHLQHTSALTGANVEAMFVDIARRTLE